MEQNLASSACLALLSAIAYSVVFRWSCSKCSYNYRVHICSHSLPLTLWYLVLGPAFPCKPPHSFLVLPPPFSLLPTAPRCGRSPLLHPTALPMLFQAHQWGSLSVVSMLGRGNVLGCRLPSALGCQFAVSPGSLASGIIALFFFFFFGTGSFALA